MYTQAYTYGTCTYSHHNIYLYTLYINIEHIIVYAHQIHIMYSKH